MTIRKRLARSNIAMLVIPLLTAAVLALLGLGAALLLLAAVALTNLYLTRSLFRHIAQPLDTLTAGVARIRDGDLETPIAYGEPDEFKSACDAVDEMAARLKASLEQQQAARQQKQELIAGMSHDLKSPLTAIRAYTEGLLEGVAQDEATRQRYLQTIYAKEADMETLVNRLFDVFYRGDAARTTPGNGSGIGLAVVKRSAQEMGGTVRAENEAGGGLRVVVTLPLPINGSKGGSPWRKYLSLRMTRTSPPLSGTIWYSAATR